MSLLVPLRTFNRSAGVRAGGKKVADGRSTFPTYVNVENPRVQRDLARHSAIGQVTANVGFPFVQADDPGVQVDGCVVTGTATNEQVSVSAGTLTLANGTRVAVAGGTLALTTAATNPKVVLVTVNTANGALDQTSGAETAGLTAYAAFVQHNTVPATPASRVTIARVFLPAADAPVPAGNIIDVRP